MPGTSCRLYLSAIRFLYLQVLKQPTFDVTFQMPKKLYRIPELLTRSEVGQILSAVNNSERWLLEHQNIHSTLHYVHWVPGQYREGESGVDLIAGLAVDHGGH